MSRDFGLLTYSTTNIGDDIQSVAAFSFLPRVDVLLNRDRIAKPVRPTLLIMNGWWLHRCSENEYRWPPPENIIPLFTSFHISPWALEILTANKSLDYLQRHAPIGCRDLYSLNVLRGHGIRAYFSACLTLTLPRPNVAKTDALYLVDVAEHAFPQIPLELRQNAVRLTHHIPGGDPDSRFLAAENLLRRYAGARLVVTSRLHCALPCVAFGTPVVFVPPQPNDPRLSGLQPYIEDVSITGFDRFSLPLSTNAFQPLAAGLSQRCREFVDG